MEALKRKIVADSSCDMTSFAEADFAAAPLKIITNVKEYVDDAGLDVAAMVSDLKEYNGRSSTSCPNTQDWLDAFGDADEVFCVTITSNLSGAYNAAVTAKEAYEAAHPGRKVCVLDSLSTGPEMVLIIEKLKELIDSGLCFAEVESRIREYMKKTHLMFMLECVDNLAKNGRVSPLIAKAVGFLNIRIVGKASDVGTLQQLHKCRGEKKALETLLGEMEKHGFAGGKVRINHAHNPAAAQALLELVRNKYPNIEPTIQPMTGLCCFYAERGSVMIGFEG